MPYKDPEKRKDRQRAYAQRPEVKDRQRAYAQRWYEENKDRQRAYAQRWYEENKDRQRAYAQRPEVKDRKRAYAQRPEVKDRKRAYRSDLTRLMKRLELDASGVEAIMKDVHAGRRYVDIAVDWLIEEGDVTAIANANGVYRRRKALPAPATEAHP